MAPEILELRPSALIQQLTSDIMMIIRCGQSAIRGCVELNRQHRGNYVDIEATRSQADLDCLCDWRESPVLAFKPDREAH